MVFFLKGTSSHLFFQHWSFQLTNQLNLCFFPDVEEISSCQSIMEEFSVLRVYLLKYLGSDCLPNNLFSIFGAVSRLKCRNHIGVDHKYITAWNVLNGTSNCSWRKLLLLALYPSHVVFCSDEYLFTLTPDCVLISDVFR